MVASAQLIRFAVGMQTIPLYRGLAAAAAFRGLSMARLAREYPAEAQGWRNSASKAFRAARVIQGVVR